MKRYLTPEEAAEELGISRSTISRCKQMGAPVQYLGTCGRIYRIDPDELREWMNEQGRKQQETKTKRVSVAELRAKRRAMFGCGA